MPDLNKTNSDTGDAVTKPTRKRVSQSDVPRLSLDQALQIPRVIADQYAKQPTRPLDVAAALNMSPTSSNFRMLCGAALGYGLTDGGPNAKQIGVTELGRRIISPLSDGDDHAAMKEAVLVPTVEREFLKRYDGSPLPTDAIAFNVFESLDVPRNATARVYGIVRRNAEQVGYLKTIKEKLYVDLGRIEAVPAPTDDSQEVPNASPANPGLSATPAGADADTVAAHRTLSQFDADTVFISAGQNQQIADQLETLLKFGGLEAITARGQQAGAIPALTDVITEMRLCSAGVVHVGAAPDQLSALPNDDRPISQRLLLELGAAIGLYGERCILLVENGVSLPADLTEVPSVEYPKGALGLDQIMAIVRTLTPDDTTG